MINTEVKVPILKSDKTDFNTKGFPQIKMSCNNKGETHQENLTVLNAI